MQSVLPTLTFLLDIICFLQRLILQLFIYYPTQIKFSLNRHYICFYLTETQTCFIQSDDHDVMSWAEHLKSSLSPEDIWTVDRRAQE